MATRSEKLKEKAKKVKGKEDKRADAQVKRIQSRDTKEVARAQKKVDRKATTRVDKKLNKAIEKEKTRSKTSTDLKFNLDASKQKQGKALVKEGRAEDKVNRLEAKKGKKDENKKQKSSKKNALDLDGTVDKRATRKRGRDVASKNRKGKRQAGIDAKKKAMEDYSPATQKGYVPSKEEMKEGRKRAYLADQAKKDAKQKKADITEMDMDQAKMKAFKKANPDRYSDAANSPAKQRADKRRYKKLTKATNKIGEKSDKQDARQAKKMMKMEDKIAGSPAKMYEGDMHSFDQMDSKNAMATAGEGPIKYFKQKISYDIKEASNSNLSQSARNNYAKNAQHDMKSMAHKHGSMKGDQSASHIDYANYKGTDKGYHGKTGASHGDQSATHRDYEGGKKKGSVLSKHFRK